MQLPVHHVELLKRLAMTGYGSIPLTHRSPVDELLASGLIETVPECLHDAFSPAPVEWLHVRLTDAGRLWLADEHERHVDADPDPEPTHSDPMCLEYAGLP